MADQGFIERLKKAQAINAENEHVGRTKKPDDHTLLPPKKKIVVNKYNMER